MASLNVLKDDPMQIVYLSHGGGPLPILGDPAHQALVDFLRRLPARLARPEAILLISAHWEEEFATLTGAARPPLIYDYYGFPRESYEIDYPASGNNELASKIASLLRERNIEARLDGERGFDHGMFIPLKLMYPQADIPTVQLSLLRGLDTGRHLDLGKALESLRSDNILVVGSGFSFHNMRAFSWGGANAPDPGNDAFQDWLITTCTHEMTPTDRERLLVNWAAAPSARYCHPREEHLLPLHVCAGLAQGPGKLVFDDYILGKRAIGVFWQ